MPSDRSLAYSVAVHIADTQAVTFLQAAILAECPADWMNLVGGYTCVRATEQEIQAATDDLRQRGLIEIRNEGSLLVLTDAGCNLVG